MKRRNLRFWSLISATSVLAMAPGAGLAEDALSASPEPYANAGGRAGGFIDEVVITARKREESLIDVPVAVTAFGARDIERYGAADLTKIGQMAPQVSINKASGSAGGFLTIRGIGTSPNNAGFDQAVSVNIDGVQVSRGRLLAAGFFDLQQVEILKGPQALFFGKNSPASVVSLTSKGPGDEFEGYARIGYEFHADEVIGEGAVSGPLTDTLGARLAARGRYMKGFLYNDAQPIANPFGPDAGPAMSPGASDPRLDERAADARVTFDYHPNDRFSAVLKVYLSAYEDDGFAGNEQGFGCAPGQGLSTFGHVDPFADCEIDNRLSKTDLPAEVAQEFPRANGGVPYSKFKSALSSLNASYSGDNYTLASVTGYADYTSRYFDTSDATAYGFYAAAERDHSWSFSQELRAHSDFDGPLNFMVGGYYQKSRINFFSAARIAAVGVDPATGKYHSFERFGTTRGETWSAFGQAMIDLTDSVELAGGARWTRETKTSDMANQFVHPGLAGVLGEATFLDRFKDNNVSPEATLSWRINDEVMVYGAYKTGYKSGGMGLSAILLDITAVDDITFRPEKAEGFEAGLKAELLGQRLRLEGSIYHYDFDDLQVNSFDPVTTSYIITNAASARQKGVELNALFHVDEALALRGSVAYNRARYRAFENATCYAGQTAATGCDPVTQSQDLTGRPTTRAPDWSASAGFSYDRPITDGWMIGLSGDAFYTSGHFVSDVQSPASYQKKFVRLDASLRVYTDDERWEVAIIGRNLTNHYYLVDSNDKPGGSGMQQYGTIARPSEVLLQLTTNF